MRKQILFVLFFIPLISIGQGSLLSGDMRNDSAKIGNSNVIVNGCTYSAACNFNPNATLDDGSCEFSSCFSFGCIYVNATNYNPESDFDDGSCEFEGLASACENDFNNDAIVNTADLNMLLGAIGTNCE